MKIWEIAPVQVESLQGTDGGPFRNFVNSVISAQMAVLGIPYSALSTDSRNMADGGVDCAVSQGSTADPNDRISSATVWQYKACSHTSLSDKEITQEICKPYAAELIKKGYAYRLCIADTLTAEKKARWEEILKTEAKSIAPNSLEPQVLTSTCLSKWASQFPSIVASLIPVDRFLHLKAWGVSAVQATRVYIKVNEWGQLVDQIKTHVDFSSVPDQLILPVHGDSGVGKTRLVYETLAPLHGINSLVLYTADEEAAESLAHFLASASDRSAILVIDECSAETRFKVQKCLEGFEERIRVITIANFARAMPGKEPVLSKMPRATVESILNANFPNVPEEQRRAAAELSGGFVGFAADICNHGLALGLNSAEQYYLARLPDDDSRRVVEAISLVKKVGFSGEFSKEFDELCALTGLNSENARRTATRLKEDTGFVAIGGRYFYVTPEVVARVALENAWKYLVQNDPAGFFERVPASLLEPLFTRIKHSGSDRFRRAAADHYGVFSSNLVPSDLSDKEKVHQLIDLIETDPHRFFPTLLDLVESAAPETLLSDSKFENGHWGPRRDVVWLCERLSAFSEHFYDIEKILFRLAVFESERGLGNNATSVWLQFFRIYLSGTSVPYISRLKILESRLASKSDLEKNLVLTALGGVFETHSSRILGPSVVAGRVPPQDWLPKTRVEEKQCYERAFEIYEKILASGDDALKAKAISAISDSTLWFLRMGFIDNLRSLMRDGRVTSPLLPSILVGVDMFLSMNASERTETGIPEPYFEQVVKWKKDLVPKDFHSRLVSIVGRYPYDFVEGPESNEWKAAIANLALAFREDASLLQSETSWLNGDAAKSSGELGAEIGKLDGDARLLGQIVARTTTQNLGLSRGYLSGLIQHHPEQIPNYNLFLDTLEKTDPKLAFDFASIAPRASAAFARWMRLAGEGKIPVASVVSFIYRLPDGMSDDETVKTLQLMAQYVGPTPSDVSAAALKVIHLWIDYHRRNQKPLSDRIDIWNLIGGVLGTAIPGHVMDNYYWKEALTVFSKVNPADSAKIASRMLAQDLRLAQDAENVLLQISSSHPEIVMKEVGNFLLNSKDGWKLQMRGCTSIISALPVETVKVWLEQTKLEGARRISGSLPRPYLDEAGNACVPELTELVLNAYGNDEKVARAFIAGSGFRSYSGDIAGQRAREAVVASKFLDHPNSVIRLWAREEKHNSEVISEHWRRESEERFI